LYGPARNTSLTAGHTVKKTFTTAEIGTRPIRLAEIGAWVKFVVEGAIFGIADPDLPVHYATFMGLR